jgi:hypothetical protein
LQRDFDDILRQAINETLSSLGEKARNAIYENLEKINVQISEIPYKIEAFRRCLVETLGQDARSVEIDVVKRLFENIGIPLQSEEFDELSLIEYIRRARMKIYEKFVGCVCSGMAVLHFENTNDHCVIKLIAANATAATIMGLDFGEDLGKAIVEIYPNMETNILESLADVIHSRRARKIGRIKDESELQAAFSILAFPLSSNCLALAFTRLSHGTKSQDELSGKENNLFKDTAEPTELTSEIPEGRHVWPERHAKKESDPAQCSTREKTRAKDL